ncbi:protein kinase domain-containing protein [Nocardiopsis sp. LOL_012]|uniref:protein kinase domain-containing protein n=1 Tax=Nocardiopsis sp. LOL_012 TaxID=3345409 RepID=UPI003A88CACB
MTLNLYVGPDSHPDKYRLVRSVGRGGEATLYLAEVALAGQTEPVVVKALNPDSVLGEERFAELSTKWGEQAELLRFINRLGVVGVREHFEGAPEHPADGAGDPSDRALYLVMNYVEGLDLRDWRAEHAVEGVRGQREALRYLEQVAVVLDVLHSGRATPSKRVVVHGDLSPGNVMISDEGQATLVDFGLSRVAARHMTARPWFTPGYAAPEVFSGEYTAATDRYAFGAVVFFTLTGEEPPPSPEQLRERFGALPLVAEAGERQRDLVLSMFSAEPGERPASSDWVRALRSLATSAPWTGPAEDPAAPVSEALSAAAVAEPLTPKEPETGEAEPPPPSGEPVAGPPPAAPPGERTSGPEAQGQAPPPAPDREEDVEDMPERPVGGMRGRPQQEGEAAEPPPGTPAGPPAAKRPGNPFGPPAGEQPGPRPPAPARPPARHRGAVGPQPLPVPPPAPVPRPHSAPTPPPASPAWSGPVSPNAAGAAPRTAPYPVAGGHPVPPTSRPREPEPGKRRSRKPRLVGLAVYGVVCMMIGAGGAYVVMDRVVPVLTASEQAGEPVDAALDEPSTGTEPGGGTTAADEEASVEPLEESADSDGVSSSASEEASAESETFLLTRFDIRSWDGTWRPEVGRAQVDGEVYGHERAIVCRDNPYAPCSGWADYYIDGDYTSFTAVIALDDRSGDEGTTSFFLYADRETLVSETLEPGESFAVDVDVTGVENLRLELESTANDLHPVWIDPALHT